MADQLPDTPVPADADRYQQKMPGFIGFFLHPFGVCAKEIGEPGGAGNTSPGSDHNAAEKEQAHG